MLLDNPSYAAPLSEIDDDNILSLSLGNMLSYYRVIKHEPLGEGRQPFSPASCQISVLCRSLLCLLLVLPIAPPGGPTPTRVRLRLDTTEAIAVLRLIDSGPTDAGWRRLFDSEGYRRLVARETAMGRGFTDSSFAVFVRSDSLRSRAGELRATLTAWEHADLSGAAARALAYLPSNARIVATVYPVIKPRPNSFVWDTDKDPAIFLFLDPTRTPAQFVNTVAHELHHIGYASVEKGNRRLPDSVKPVAKWIGALGEGFAMLAAAGGPGVHPHASSPPADRERWDRDVAHFNEDLKRLDGFFADILAHRFPTADSVQSVAMSFFGVQGPWYTVGWRMAVLIERRFGRPELIRCMMDPQRLLVRYNRAAGDSLARWSPAVVASLAPE